MPYIDGFFVCRMMGRFGLPTERNNTVNTLKVMLGKEHSDLDSVYESKVILDLELSSDKDTFWKYD